MDVETVRYMPWSNPKQRPRIHAVKWKYHFDNLYSLAAWQVAIFTNSGVAIDKDLGVLLFMILLNIFAKCKQMYYKLETNDDIYIFEQKQYNFSAIIIMYYVF